MKDNINNTPYPYFEVGIIPLVNTMKKYFILMALVIISAIAVAQESATKVQRQGNNFIQTSEKSISAHSEAEDNSTIINYTFTTKDGVGHQLHMSKSGSVYYWKISKKGNEYKVYIKDEKVISQIHNELGFKKE